MEIMAHRLLHDSITDFKNAAVLVESEISRHSIEYDGFDVVSDLDGRTHHHTWVSMKGVSHFNLGISLELMLKLLLYRNDISLRGINPPPDRHRLAVLHCALPDVCKKQLERTYRKSLNEFGLPELVMFNNETSTSRKPGAPPPTTHKLASLGNFFDYLDRRVMMWLKRYSWEAAEEGIWRYYLNDISVFVDLIERTMQDIPPNISTQA